MNNLLSFASVTRTVGSIVLAILILLLMITIHEFGHYITGKILKFKINEFAIGMGPAIFKKKNEKTGEIFSIRLFPLGGFCAFDGEDEDKADNPDAFNNKEPWKRIIVLVSGALMNLILGITVLCLSIGFYGQMLIETYDVKPTTMPEYAGYSLENDDQILKIENKTIFMPSDIGIALKNKKQGDVVEVTVLKDGKTEKRNVRLRNDVTGKNVTDVESSFTALGISTIFKIDETYGETELKGGEFVYRVKDKAEYLDCTRVFNTFDLISYAKSLAVGDTCSYYIEPQDLQNGTAGKTVDVIINEDLSTKTNEEILNYLGIKSATVYYKYATVNKRFGFFQTIGRGLKYSVSIGGVIFKTLGELLTGKLGLNAVGGPITTISITSTAIKTGGFSYFLEIGGFIGVNLALFNLLPIPALDGSRVVFCIIEWIRKKPVNRKVEAVIHTVGLMLLLGFSIMVDLLQLF